MHIPTIQITDNEKKNELIHFANAKGAKAVFSDRYKGMVIEVYNKEVAKAIKRKIKELAEQ